MCVAGIMNFSIDEDILPRYITPLIQLKGGSDAPIDAATTSNRSLTLKQCWSLYHHKKKHRAYQYE